MYLWLGFWHYDWMIENDRVPLGWQAIRTSGPQWFYDWMAAGTLPKTLRLAEASSFNTHRSSEFCSECSNSAAMAKLIGESQILRLISVFRSSPANSWSNPSAAKVVVRKSLQAVARSLVEDVFEVSCGILIQNGISGTLLWTATTTSCDQKRRSKRWSIFKVEEKWTVSLALVFFLRYLSQQLNFTSSYRVSASFQPVVLKIKAHPALAATASAVPGRRLVSVPCVLFWWAAGFSATWPMWISSCGPEGQTSPHTSTFTTLPSSTICFTWQAPWMQIGKC